MKSLAFLFLFAGFAAYGATALDDAQRLYAATNYSAAADKLQGAGDAASLRLLGQAYLQMNDLNRASDTLEKAVDADPKSSEGYLLLGRAYGLRAQNATLSAAPLAIKTRINFEKAYSLDPHNWDAAGDLFEFYLQAPAFMGGGLDKASKMADAIAAHDPSEGASPSAGKIFPPPSSSSAAPSNWLPKLLRPPVMPIWRNSSPATNAFRRATRNLPRPFKPRPTRRK